MQWRSGGREGTGRRQSFLEVVAFELSLIEPWRVFRVDRGEASAVDTRNEELRGTGHTRGKTSSSPRWKAAGWEGHWPPMRLAEKAGAQGACVPRW